MDNVRELFTSSAFEIGIRLVAVSSLLVGGVALKNGYDADEKRARLAKCVFEYTEADQARSKILSAVGTEASLARNAADEAEAVLFTDPATLKPADKRTSAEQARLAGEFVSYQSALIARRAAVQKDIELRKKNPVPPPPSARCAIDNKDKEALKWIRGR